LIANNSRQTESIRSRERVRPERDEDDREHTARPACGRAGSWSRE